MSDPTTFRELRTKADLEGRRAMCAKGEEVGHPVYGNGPRGLSEWTCPNCKVTVQRSDAGTAFKPCTCLSTAYNEGRLAFVKARRPVVLAAELERTGMQSLYMDATFAAFKPREGAEEALHICREYADSFDPDEPEGLILFGPSGTGKTHLATAILHRIMADMDVAPVFVEAVQLLHEIRRRQNGEEDPVDRCKAAPLLVLDDLGNHQVTPFAQDQLYAILTGRYTARRPTIVTTNCDGPKLTELFGPAFRSRLYQMCKTVPLVATDCRLKGRKEE